MSDLYNEAYVKLTQEIIEAFMIDNISHEDCMRLLSNCTCAVDTRILSHISLNLEKLIKV